MISKAFSLFWGIFTLFYLVLGISSISLAAEIYVDCKNDSNNNQFPAFETCLRGAVFLSNSTQNQDDIITLDKGTYTISINGNNENDNYTGDLDIKDSVTIQGESPEETIIAADNNFLDRAFQIHNPGTKLTLKNLTIRNFHPQDAGAVLATGPTGEGANIVLDNVIFEQNNSSLGASTMAVYHLESLVINDSIFKNNHPQNDNILPRENMEVSTLQFEMKNSYLVGNGPNVIRLKPENAVAHIENSTFFANQANNLPGALEVISEKNGSSQLSIVASKFQQNQTNGQGGALLVMSEGPQKQNFRVHVNNSRFYHNQADRGGAISCIGEINYLIENSLVQNNVAERFGGGIYTSCSKGQVENSQFFENQASPGINQGEGGAIRVKEGSLTINRSWLRGNFTSGLGGAILADLFGQELITITNSTISDNIAINGDGGIYVSRNDPENFDQLSVYIANSTISDNVGYHGGAAISLNNGILLMNHATVTRNWSQNPGAGLSLTHSDGDGSVKGFIKNSIIAHNRKLDLSFSDCTYDNFIFSLDHNLDSDGSCGFWQAHDLPNKHPQLEGLAQNGGPTPTHALLKNSPAINAGTENNTLVFDQRGSFFYRKCGPATDIGAYEHQANCVIDDIIEP